MTIQSLGYIGLSVADTEAWATFGEDILGLMKVEGPDGSLRFRLDSYAWRIAVEKGEADDIAYAGFEVAGLEVLDAFEARLKEAGVAVTRGDEALAKKRAVSGLIACQDPDGLAVEIYYGPSERYETPFVSSKGVSGFVTGDQGLGHFVFATPDIARAKKFYCDLLGFRLSDTIRMEITPEFALNLEFFHCNPRHHTLAMAPIGLPKKLNHFMVEVKSIDDVGFALDRVAANDVPLAMTLGRHTNDHMVSFYVHTPSGFEVEYGFGARVVDEETWRVSRHDSTSAWGHKRAG
ncbi:MAG: biphenyl-2,3-diol 1,2-dioxygenase [Parvibaculum sp.]